MVTCMVEDEREDRREGAADRVCDPVGSPEGNEGARVPLEPPSPDGIAGEAAAIADPLRAAGTAIDALVEEVASMRAPWRQSQLRGEWRLAYLQPGPDGTGIDRRVPFPELPWNDSYQVSQRTARRASGTGDHAASCCRREQRRHIKCCILPPTFSLPPTP